MTLDELITDLKAAGANENTIKLAMNCYEFGQSDARNMIWTQAHWTEYEHAIVAAEREACAKVCEEYETANDITATWLNIVAEAIRARGQQ
jgi:hypothetical protein